MFLIRFADMLQTRHVSALRNVQMSARRGADSQDSPATRHPKADVLSQSSVRTNDSCGLQYCEYSICRDKKDSISAVFVVKEKQALAKMQCPRYESAARRSASAGCRYWSTGRTGDRIFPTVEVPAGHVPAGQSLCGGPGCQRRRRNGYHRRKTLQTWCTGTCAARVCRY